MADWAFGWWCSLDPTHFTSPPTAISNQHGLTCSLTLTHPDAFNITYGRIILQVFAVPATWVYHPRTAIAFRCQAFPGYPLCPRFYDVVINHDVTDPPGSPHIKLFRNVDLFPTLLAQWAFPPPLNAWTNYQLTWIPNCSQPQPKPLLITLEHGAPGAWNLIGSYSDPVNLGAGAASNQIGLSLIDDQHWLDDVYLHQFHPSLDTP